MTNNTNLVGKFLCHRKDSPMTDGLIYKASDKRIFFVSALGEDRYVSRIDFTDRKDSAGNAWYWVQDKPTDTFWWTPEMISRRKAEKKLTEDLSEANPFNLEWN